MILGKYQPPAKFPIKRGQLYKVDNDSLFVLNRSYLKDLKQKNKIALYLDFCYILNSDGDIAVGAFLVGGQVVIGIIKTKITMLEM